MFLDAPRAGGTQSVGCLSCLGSVREGRCLTFTDEELVFGPLMKVESVVRLDHGDRARAAEANILAGLGIPRRRRQNAALC